jgi:hypothetical protein
VIVKKAIGGGVLLPLAGGGSEVNERGWMAWRRGGSPSRGALRQEGRAERAVLEPSGKKVKQEEPSESVTGVCDAGGSGLL